MLRATGHLGVLTILIMILAAHALQQNPNDYYMFVPCADFDDFEQDPGRCLLGSVWVVRYVM